MAELASTSERGDMTTSFPTVDERTREAVQTTDKIMGLTALAGFAVLALWVAICWFSGGFFNALVAAVVSVFVFMGYVYLANLLVLGPMQRRRYKACVRAIQTMAQGAGLQPALQWTWHDPSPGIIMLDTRRRWIFTESAGSRYCPLLLDPSQIIGCKVERESEVHTTTTHSGHTSVFGSNVGYAFGGTSRSHSTVIERAFLEIHYQLHPDEAPGWIAIPFGANRRDADSMAAAIMAMNRQ